MAHYRSICLEQGLVPNPCGGANELSTNLALSHTPATTTWGGWINVMVNGAIVRLGNGIKTKDCYYSADAGVTAKSAGNFVIGDMLYWNALIIGYNLDALDKICFFYVI
jgi:hypothetical protein